MHSIHINLHETFVEVLDELVESGLYPNRTELIKEALGEHHAIKRLIDKRRQKILNEMIDSIPKPKPLP